jgi:hypothetical protein
VQLRAEYIGVMARVLSGHFKTYLAALEKMAAAVAGEAGTCTGGIYMVTDLRCVGLKLLFVVLH